ncbi:hypothetical protein [Methanobrevibacter smithii]|uniref:hypothetical protein n=1 Tax=Methanobrevibacter smithii TaxID=2173 RepID=UPI00035E4029|nr:hypothetical protein [Methanobrevibacter smithii]
MDQSELRIYINLSDNKYNIVEYDDATHVLVQKFDDVMELTFQEIHVLKKIIFCLDTIISFNNNTINICRKPTLDE